MNSKPCKDCGIDKPLTDFYKHSRMKDGHLNKCKECQKAYQNAKSGERKEYMYEWHSKNKDQQKQYYDDNREHYQEYHRNYTKNKRATDPHYQLTQNLRSRLRAALSGRTKGSSVKLLVGVSIEKLMEHLESQFTEGMSWDNYGKWHVDHIKPLAAFEDPEDRNAWCLDNLQPLWASDNCKKGSKV